MPSDEEMMIELDGVILSPEDQEWIEWKQNYDPDMTKEDTLRLIRLYEENFGYGRE